MAYTLGTAAKETGKSKTTIKRSIDKGRLSAKKNEAGEWQIDPAELHRVYPVSVPKVEQNLQGELHAAHKRITELERNIQDLRDDRDHWRQESEDWKQQTKLLTDQRGSNGGGFWARVFGRS